MFVSVVIPVHNAGSYLSECLESVLSQDYGPFEVIAVDNNSTDSSVEVLRQFADRGVRVISESHAGAAAARNAGVKAARGDLIAFQDADDVWLPGKLTRQVEFLRENQDFGIVFGQFANWYPDEDGQYGRAEEAVGGPGNWEVKESLSGWIYADTLLSCPIAMITPVVRREVFDAVGCFDESLEAGSDYDFWLRASYRYKAHKLPGCLALYRHHGKGITSRARPYSTIALIIGRALSNTGRTGPDGRTVTQEQLDARLAEIWLHFGILHFTKGQVRIGLEALSKYLLLERSATSAAKSLFSMVPPALFNRVKRELLRAQSLGPPT